MNSFLPEPLPSPPEDPHSSAFPTLDVAQLRARCLGNEILVRQVLGKLEPVLRREYSEAKEAWGRRGFQALAMTAHRLKGTAANVGAEALRQELSRLECAARGDDIKECSQAIRQVETEIERLLVAVDRLGEI